VSEHAETPCNCSLTGLNLEPENGGHVVTREAHSQLGQLGHTIARECGSARRLADAALEDETTASQFTVALQTPIGRACATAAARSSARPAAVARPSPQSPRARRTGAPHTYLDSTAPFPYLVLWTAGPSPRPPISQRPYSRRGGLWLVQALARASSQYFLVPLQAKR
jgi:hypothetical protein